MQANPQRIKLDMTSKATATAQVVRVMRYDSKSRPVSASIYDDGAFRDDLNVNNARLYIESLSDAPPTYVENIAIVSGIADFTIPQSATLTAGIMRAELRVVDSASGQVITSMPFVIECTQSVYSDDAVMGTDNGDVLINAVASATQSAAAAQSSASAAEASADSAEESAATAQTAATNAAASAAQAADSVDSNAVKFSAEQELNDEQKAVARNNIGAINSTKSSNIADVEIMLHAVKFSAPQLLSDEEKSQARNNIGAVAASKVKSSLSANDDIPNAEALVKHLSENAVQFSFGQSLSDAQKSIARKNIGVDGGKWVLLRTYTTDGVDKAFGDGTTSNAGTTTTDGDGNALSLSAVAVIFKNTTAAAANSFVTCFAYCNAADESILAGYSVATNAINAKADAQGVAMVMSERGYYRSLSVNGAANSSVNLCENPSRVFSAVSSNTIKRIKITLGAIPPADDIIERWGIKA